MSHAHDETPLKDAMSTSAVPPASAAPTPVIFTRTSQCNAQYLHEQERTLRGVLTEHGVDTTVTTVIREIATAGSGPRPGHEHLQRLVDAGQVSALAVMDITRLGRGTVALKLVESIMAQGATVYTEQGPLPTDHWQTIVTVTAWADEARATRGRILRRRAKGRFRG